MYEFEIESYTQYTFETDTGIAYEVVFSPMDFIFDDENVLKNNIYELSIELVTKLKVLPPKDEKIEVTIAEIVKTFFINEPSSFAVFHVANIDKKVSLRKRLFSSWFDKYNDNFLEKHDKIIEDQFDIFYVSLILRVDNPLKENVLKYFSDWINMTNATK